MTYSISYRKRSILSNRNPEWQKSLTNILIAFSYFLIKDYFSAYFLESFDFSIFYIDTTILCDDIKGFASRLSLSKLSGGGLNLLIEIVIPTNTELLRTDYQWRGKRTFSLLLLSWYLNIIWDVSLKYMYRVVPNKASLPSSSW